MAQQFKNNHIKSFLLFFLITLPLIFKMIYVDNFLYHYSGIRAFGALQVLANDAIIYAVIIYLFYLSYISQVSLFLSVLLRLLGFTVIGIYTIDFWIIKNFNTHLIASDIIKYASYSLKYIQQTSSGKSLRNIFVLLMGAFFLIPFIISKTKITHKKIHKISISTIISLILIYYFTTSGNDKYVHSWVYKNVVSHNLTIMSEAKEYSEDFKRNFHYKEAVYSQANTPENKNIIILMVESLSSYQSNFFSGIKDWTPNLDNIAKNNKAYKNFYSNGFTTEDCEISILTGRLPIYPPSSYSNGGGISFNGFFNIKDSLPNILNAKAYSTEFLTTADLGFSNTRKWGQSIGFKYLEGHEHPYYNKWERHHFKSAPDEALYQRALDRLRYNNNNNKNFLIFMKTVSTHHPFVNPENKKKSEAEVFKYADKHIGLFHKELIKRNFFKNGILIIVGDHHSMVPLKNEEITAFGKYRAAARVPMIISYGNTKPSIEAAPYQHTDIFNSLKGLVSNAHTYTNWSGNFLINQPAKFIAHRRGDNRNLISVFTEKEESLIKLNGDFTKIDNNTPTDSKTQKLIVNKVNAARLPNDHDQILPKKANERNSLLPLRVAHAGGGINNTTYTNSYEALNENLKKGFLYFELDFLFTADEKLICLHDWKRTFKATFGYHTNKKLTLKEFEALVKKQSKFTNCTLDGLALWMRQNPQAHIITDVKEENLKALRIMMKKLPNASKRVIPQIYNPRNFNIIKNLGYEKIIWTLYRYNGSNSDVLKWIETFYGTIAITMPTRRAETNLAKELKKINISSYVHTINKIEEQDRFTKNLSITEIYTDFLSPKTKKVD